MNFRQLKTAVQRQFNDMKDEPLFRVDIDKDKIWELYLKSFPEGMNPMFRKRTEHDCSCCRAFIKNIGGLVAIKNGALVSIWQALRARRRPRPQARTFAIQRVLS